MRMTPCESWPARLAPTSASPISRARSSGAPAPLKMRSVTSRSSVALRFAMRLSLVPALSAYLGFVRRHRRSVIHVEPQLLEPPVELAHVERRDAAAREQVGRLPEQRPSIAVDWL